MANRLEVFTQVSNPDYYHIRFINSVPHEKQLKLVEYI